ncbi:MAG: cytochrome c [Chitinophagaceae bacterium]|nr:MAG: cytochrome c [Chitinophagaceae bacterium]
MKIYATVSVLIVTVFTFSYCSSSKSAAKKATPVSYASSVQTLLVGHCSPCHIPEKGGKKKAYDTYASVKGDIDEIIRRIELHPGEKGFMPFKKERLSDSTIAVIKEWKTQGLAE